MSTSMLLLSLAPYSHSMSTFRDLGPQHDISHQSYSGRQQHTERRACRKDLPVTGDIEVKVADVRCVFRQNNVAGELARGEPEGKVWNIVELELGMNPAEVNRKSSLCRSKCSKCILPSKPSRQS